MSQRTRTVKENNSPAFNETLFFEVPLKKEYILDPQKYIQKINEEFLTKNELVFNLMIEGDDNTYDNLGISYFHLSGIKDGEKSSNKFYADNLKRIKEYSSRKVTRKEKIHSAFSQSSNTYIHFDAWFLSDFPETVDFGEKNKKRQDPIPAVYKNFLDKRRRTVERMTEDFYASLGAIFIAYTKFPYKDRLFDKLLITDQYENEHLMPYFLSPITPPEKLYSKEEKAKSSWFDTNLKSLDEIAHYVRCYVRPKEKLEGIWSSPDLMMKVRKGTVQDHALLMASLMLGLRTTKTVQVEETTPDEEEETPLTEMEPLEEESFPFEKRVFVCVGKMRLTNENYAWVLTFSEDYKDVTIWDPVMPYKYDLPGRVVDSEKLKDYLQGSLFNQKVRYCE